MPLTLTPLAIALRTTARIAAFMPGASPPLVRTPIGLISFATCLSSCLFCTIIVLFFCYYCNISVIKPLYCLFRTLHLIFQEVFLLYECSGSAAEVSARAPSYKRSGQSPSLPILLKALSVDPPASDRCLYPQNRSPTGAAFHQTC